MIRKIVGILKGKFMDNNKIVFVVEAYNEIGEDVVTELKAHGYGVIESDTIPRRQSDKEDTENIDSEVYYVQLDVFDAKVVERVFSILRPDAVIHCVKRSESGKNEKNRKKTQSTNELAIKNLAEAAEKINAKMITIPANRMFSETKDLARYLVNMVG